MKNFLLPGITLVKSLQVLMVKQFHWAGNLAIKGFAACGGGLILAWVSVIRLP